MLADTVQVTPIPAPNVHVSPWHDALCLELASASYPAPLSLLVRQASDGDTWLLSDPPYPEPTRHATLLGATAAAVVALGAALTRHLLERHGLPDCRPHDLRHGAATLAIEAGADLIDVSRLLGHANLRVTSRLYVGRIPCSMRRAAEALVTLMGPEWPNETINQEEAR